MASTHTAIPELGLLGRLPPEFRETVYHYASDETITVYQNGQTYYRSTPAILSENPKMAAEFVTEFKRLPTNDLTHVFAPCTVGDTGLVYAISPLALKASTSARVIIELKQEVYLDNTFEYEAWKEKLIVCSGSSGVLALLAPHYKATHVAIEINGEY